MHQLIILQSLTGKDKDSTRTPRTKVSPRVAGKENGDKTSTDSGEGASKKAGSGGDGGRGGHDATAAAEEEVRVRTYTQTYMCIHKGRQTNG